MLMHFASASHKFLHSSMLEIFPGEVLRYDSPALVSHTALFSTNTQRLDRSGAAVVTETEVVADTGVATETVVGTDPALNRNAVAFLILFVVEHGVLKWLHHPLL